MDVEIISDDSVAPEKSLISVSSVKVSQCKSPSIQQQLDEKISTHRNNKFTGIVYIVAEKKVFWKLFFRSGRLKWALAKDNQTRSWYRQMRLHYPSLLEKISRREGVYNHGESFPHHEIAYPYLIKQLQAREIEGIPLARAVESYLGEILFDILQEGFLRQKYGEPQLSLVDKEKNISRARLLSVRIDSVWKQAKADWEDWQNAGLLNCSPTLKPVISQVQQLKDYIPEEVYQCLSDIVQDDLCLRDLAVDLGQSLLAFTKRINPFIQQGMIGLVAIDDFSDRTSSVKKRTRSVAADNCYKQTRRKAVTAGVKSVSRPKQSLSKEAKKTGTTQPLIVYVEDSQVDSQKMEEIVKAADCRYFNIQESIHAIPLLIEKKPQLIFLDLVMPIANGYEICTQIRRVSCLKDVPVVIVTSNNGLPDRVRAKVIGASGFLSKPISSEKVLSVLTKAVKKTL